MTKHIHGAKSPTILRHLLSIAALFLVFALVFAAPAAAAEGVVTIGETSYQTLQDAINDAENGDTINLGEGTFTLPSISNKVITFKGTKASVINMHNAQPAASGSTLTFEGVTFEYDEGTAYRGIQHSKKVIYNDCAFTGLLFLYGEEEVFTDCTFENYADYNLWTYGAKKVTFTDCTFYSGGRCIYVHNEMTDSSFVADITLTNCTFNDNDSMKEDDGVTDLLKGAVETGSNGKNTATSNKYDITFISCTINGFQRNGVEVPLSIIPETIPEEFYKFCGNKNKMDADHLKVTFKQTVRWLNDDGTELDKKTVEYGTTAPSYSGEDPRKTATDDEYCYYTFAGWTPEVAAVTGDTTYTATFTGTAHSYTSWASNGDNTHTGTCVCGKTSTVDCSGGTATCTEQAICDDCRTAYGVALGHDYAEAWTQGETTHYHKCTRCDSTKDEAEHSYTSWASNGDNTHTGTCVCGQTSTVACFGGTATCTEPAVCAACGTAYGVALGHDYAETWTQGETTHYHKCTRCDSTKDEAEHSYTAWASNGDATHTGTCVCGKTSTVACTEVIDPAVPSSGTQPGKTEGKHCSVCKAVLVKQKPTYSVIWANETGIALYENVSVPSGEEVIAPEAPAKDADLEYTFTFSGWENESKHTVQPGESVTVIEGDAYKATYTATVNAYRVIFQNETGFELSNITIPYGDPITAPEEPTKEADAEYIYTFKEWVNVSDASDVLTEGKTVSGDVTYKATYTATPINYVADTITLNPKTESYILNVNDTIHESTDKITATATNKTNTAAIFPIKWDVTDGKDNVSIVDYKDGNVTITAVKAGTATVTATSGDISKSVTIDVLAIKLPKTPDVKDKVTVQQGTEEGTIVLKPSDENKPFENVDTDADGKPKAEIKDETAGVTLTVTFDEKAVVKTEENSDKVKEISGEVTAVTATYEKTEAAAPSEVGTVNFELNLNLKTDNLQEAAEKLPTVDPNMKREVVKEVTDNGLKPITMITADSGINSYLSTDGEKIVITFTLDTNWVTQNKNKLVWFHMDDNGLGTPQKILEKDISEDETDPTKTKVTVRGTTFSTYGIAVEEPKQDTTPEKPSGGNSYNGGTTTWLPSTPTPTPTETVTPQPTETVPTTAPTSGTAQPTATEAESPLSVLGVLAGLGAVVVLRRR